MPSSDPVLDRLLSDDFSAAGLQGVGVHIWRDDSGNTTVILYGFVGPVNQRDKAEQRAAEMFTDVNCSICDRPELLASASMAQRANVDTAMERE